MTNANNVERTKIATKNFTKFFFIGKVWLLSARLLLTGRRHGDRCADNQADGHE
jgi:hypothetical protein